MSQPQPTQQHEFPMMFKQFQELQQKRQLQKLGYMGQQNRVDQLCLFNKPTPGIQVPPLFNGTPFRDAPNMFSQCQSQAVSPMGVLPHEPNMSTYGSPVVGLGNNLSPQPNLQGLCNDMCILTDSDIVQVELSGISHETFNNSFMSEQSNVSCCDSGHAFMSGIGLAPKQVFPESFGQIHSKGMVVKQVSTSQSKSLMQNSCGGQEQVSSSDLSAQKLPNTQSARSLGPLEQKILFVRDDSWQPNLGEQGNAGGISGAGRISGSSDCVSSFPTVHSGSLSALMQTAVAEASSSDTGLQECSGISFQNPELSSENQPSNYVHSRGQQNNAIHNTMQKAWSPTSKPKLLGQSYTMNFKSQGLQQLNHKFPGHEEIHSGSQLDTSGFHGQTVTLDATYQRSKKHLLNQSHTDGDILEHRTGTLYKSKEFVQSSEKIQKKASELSIAHPENSSSIAQSSIGLRLGSPSQGIPRLHTSPESLTLFYNQLQNQSLPLHVGSHSPQEMFATQGLEAMPVSKLRVLSNVNRQAARSLGSEIPAQQPQSKLGFRKFSSNFFQPMASTTSSLEHIPRTSEEQDSQSLFRDKNYSEVIDSSLQNPQGFNSNEGEQVKSHHQPPSARDHDSFGHYLRAPQALHQNYSLEKVQSLIKAENSHDKMSGKYKGARIMAGSGASVGEQYNSLSFLGYKALRFPSETSGDQVKKDISQIIVCDSTEMAMLSQCNETVRTSIGSNNVKEGKLSLQMAPSGFKHQRNSKNLQILSMLATKSTSHQLPVDQNFDIRSKKRKLDSFDFLPWYKQVTQASLKFPDFRIELEWCLASNRRSQRVENEAEVLQNSALIHQPKRRLTKSTQLMQQFFPPSPTVIISADAFSNCDSVVYFVAKLALGDACNMTCDFHMQSSAGDMLYGKVETPGIRGGKDLLNTMETFICRVERLHADIIRQEEQASFLDLKVESQEVEKFTTINRLARFLSQGSAAADATSTVTPVVLKPAPQRYVVAFPMPKTMPRGVKCLSL